MKEEVILSYAQDGSNTWCAIKTIKVLWTQIYRVVFLTGHTCNSENAFFLEKPSTFCKNRFIIQIILFLQNVVDDFLRKNAFSGLQI